MTACFNPANATSAKLVFAKFKEVEFTTQKFIFPGIRAGFPVVTTPHMALPMGAGTIHYENLVLDFIIDSTFANYFSIVEWLQKSPTTANKELFSDASVTLLSNKKNPIANVYFKDVMPISISPITFEYDINDPQPIIGTAEFVFTYYTMSPL